MSDEVETLETGELVYRASDPQEMNLREEADTAPVLEGRMMPYDEWTEVRSSVEKPDKHFMERFVPGALAKTISEQSGRIRALFEHGHGFLDVQPIAAIDEMRDELDGAYYRAGILEGLPPLLLAGLRRGLYGSSIRFMPIKWDRNKNPGPSEHNPQGLPEHTIREALVREFSVVTFPQYAGATARIRSITDEMTAKPLLKDPAKLLELIEALRSDEDPALEPVEVSEPEHSRPNPEVVPPAQGSRSTRHRDYLSPEKEMPKWQL